MPNWCEGTLKIRGPIENIKKFFEEGLEVIDNTTFENIDKHIWFVKEITNNYIYYMFRYRPHIIGTNRAYIKDWKIYIDISEIVENNYPVIFTFNQAWDVRVDDWVNLSKKYGLDFRLYGFEPLNEFCRDVEVINGGLTVNNTIKYKDYIWECPMPEIGG